MITIRVRLATMRCIAEAKTARLRARWLRSYQPRAVLFYPFQPHPFSAIYKICHQAGFHMCYRYDSDWDVGIHWDTATQREALSEEILSSGRRVLNAACLDVGKIRLSAIFADVFGYPLALDPTRHRGPCVRKSCENATHDGVILDCPIPEAWPGFVYQRLVHNEVSSEAAEDLRVPYICGGIPFVYRKMRPISDRFSNLNLDVSCCPADEAFSESERERIAKFCRILGMDYGELDILRDKLDGRIYIVDANPTPWGPPNHIRAADRAFAIQAMTGALERSLTA